MIQRVSQADTLRSYSPLRSQSPASSGPVDGFQRSHAESTPVYSARPEFKAQPEAPKSLWKTAMLAAVMTTSATAGIAGLTATPAMAQSTQQANPANVKDQGLKLLMNSKAAKGEQVPLEQALGALKPAVQQRLKTLPKAAQQAYANLETPAKKFLNERIHGTTSAAMGLIQVDNKDAFIQGTAVGQDVFAIAKRGVEKQVAAGTIPREMAGRLNGAIDLVSKLTPDQRATVVRALELDLSK